MNDYKFDDPELQKRYEEFSSNMESLCDLSSEAMILRAMVNRSLNANRDRVALDALSQLTKTVQAIHEQQKQLGLLIKMDEVKQVVFELTDLIHGIVAENVTADVTQKIMDAIAVAVRGKRTLMLEVKRDE